MIGGAGGLAGAGIAQRSGKAAMPIRNRQVQWLRRPADDCHLAPEDPASTLYGIMMFLPIAAMILAGIALTAAIRDVTPSLMNIADKDNPCRDQLNLVCCRRIGDYGIAVLAFLVFQRRQKRKALQRSLCENAEKEEKIRTIHDFIAILPMYSWMYLQKNNNGLT